MPAESRTEVASDLLTLSRLFEASRCIVALETLGAVGDTLEAEGEAGGVLPKSRTRVSVGSHVDRGEVSLTIPSAPDTDKARRLLGKARVPSKAGDFGSCAGGCIGLSTAVSVRGPSVAGDFDTSSED